MSEAYAELIQAEFQHASLALSNTLLDQLTRYCEELSRWSQRINLTALSGRALVRRLIVEPMWIGQRLEMSGLLLDIGSGNGSPAIPLCLTNRFRYAHLVEVRTRRAVFLRHVISKLTVNASVHRTRIEDLTENVSEVDWITLQAVHPSVALVRALRRFSKPTTNLVWITSTTTATSEWVAGTRVATPFSGTEAVVMSMAASTP